MDGSHSYSGWVGASRAMGWVEHSPSGLLQCLCARGGVGFIGDSVMRETVNALLSLLEVGEKVDTTVGHSLQSYVKHLQCPPQGSNSSSSGGGGVSVPLAFRFSRNLHPELIERAQEVLSRGVGGLVAGSGFWDMNLGQGGANEYTVLKEYTKRMASFLLALQPLVTLNHILVWRSITPIAFSRAPEDRRGYLSYGRTTAVNALARRLVTEGWKGQPRWRYIDTAPLFPPSDLDNLEVVSADGYHPSVQTLKYIVFGIFSELCPPFGEVSLEDIEAAV